MELEGLVIPISFELGGLLAGVNAIKDLITGAVDATFQWEDGLHKLGEVTGMNTDQTAAWAFVAQKAGVNVDTLSRQMVMMEKGLIKTNGALDTGGEKLQKLGINVKDANGKIRDQSSLMNDIAKKYAGFATQQEKVNFLTEIFGRSGADLVDVFSTLAQEGGIDAVTQKVKDMGLAIDPDKYVQFQRSLSELQMVGLGLEVAFTEKLMPMLEGMLTWGEKFAKQDWKGKVQMVTDELSKFNLPDITQKFRDWVASVDWNALSTAFADGMNKVDWAGGTKAALDSGVNIEEALIDIVKRTNWSGLGKAIQNALTGIIRDGIGKAIVTAWTPAAQGFWALVDNMVAISKQKIAAFFPDIISTIQSWSGGFYSAGYNALTSFENGINSALSNTYSSVVSWLNKISAPITSAISTISTGLSSISGSSSSSSSSSFGSGIGSHAGGGPGGGLSWVGEHGPELVNLPSGSYVNTATNSARMSDGMDYDELSRVFGRVLGEQLQRIS